MPYKSKKLNLNASITAVCIWTAAWLLLFALDGTFNLANLSLLLVLASAMAGMFLSTGMSLLITIATHHQGVDAKSVAQVMGLGAEHNDLVELHAEGDDAQAAINALIAVIQK